VAPKYLIETFGSQMNYHDSEQLAGLHDAEGNEAAGDE
jgi:tRNA A37 methylthiotransferase MiaB